MAVKLSERNVHTLMCIPLSDIPLQMCNNFMKILSTLGYFKNKTCNIFACCNIISIYEAPPSSTMQQILSKQLCSLM